MVRVFTVNNVPTNARVFIPSASACVLEVLSNDLGGLFLNLASWQRKYALQRRVPIGANIHIEDESVAVVTIGNDRIPGLATRVRLRLNHRKRRVVHASQALSHIVLIRQEAAREQ